jgi:hypothetical protein
MAVLKDYLTVPQAAAKRGVSRQAILHLIDERKLKATRKGPGRAQELAKRPRKNGANLKPEANPPKIPPLQTAAQIRDFLAQVMTDLRTRNIDGKTASVLASLATAQLRAVSAAELETRISDLEKKVNEVESPKVGIGLPSPDQWEKLFAPDDYTVPPSSQPASQEGSEGPQSTRGRRTMPEGWTVPEHPPEDVANDWSVPLNRR